MHKPFEILEEWVRQGRIRLASPVAVPPNGNGAETLDDSEPREFAEQELPVDLSDEALFQFAMRDVKSLVPPGAEVMRRIGLFG